MGGTYFPSGLDAEGDYSAESAWDSGGGGVDTAETQSAAQKSDVGNLGGRAVPDVAFDAGTPVAVYDSDDYGGIPWISLDGTSIGAPAWSALIAIADQGRALVGRGTLDGSSQTLPDLYSIYGTPGYAQAFNDITSGGNNLAQAGSGFDLVTGLGTPKAAAIAASLSGDTVAPPLIAPGASVVVTTTQPAFQWGAVPGAVGYVLAVTDDTTGAQVFTQTLTSSADGGSDTS